MSTALSKVGLAGKTICVRGGTYGSGFSTTFVSRLKGTASAPVILRNYPGERATINASITSNGADLWFWGLEIMNSNADRTNGTNRPPGLTLYGARDKVINCVIHDTGHPGIGFWRTVGDGGEVYGTIFWGIGSLNAEVGSAIYAQNKDGTRYIRDIISFKNVNTGFKAFTTNTYANGFHIEGNTSFQNGEWDIFTVSRNYPLERLKVLNNMTYKMKSNGEPSYQFGYERDNDPGRDIVMNDNYFAGGSPGESGRGAVTGRLFTNVTALRNTIISYTTLVRWTPCGMVTGCSTVGFPESYNWNGSAYYYLGTSATPFSFGDTSYNYAGWKTATGFDASSTYTAGRPPNKVFVRPNLYERGRANITIYNWQLLPSVQVNISTSGLLDGEQYEARDAQNFYGSPVARGTYSSSNPTVNIPMTGLTAVPLIGSLPPVNNAHTAPEFGVFVLIKK